MPILDIGYRNWNGPRSPSWTRCLVVAATGVSLVWQGTWTKRLLLLLVFPSIVVGIMVGAFEQTIADQSTRRAIRIIESDGSRAREVMQDAGLDFDKVKQDPELARHFVWTYLLFSLFRYPQAFGMILLLGIVAPRLISYDLRTRAYLLYLSRPLTPWEYVVGKAGVLYVLIIAVAAVPAVAIYLFGLILSTNTWAIAQTWDIPLRIFLATILLVLPTSAIALALSSMTRESRYASFAWFALWLIGQTIYGALRAAYAIGQSQMDEAVNSDEMANRYIMYFSPYETLGYLQKKVFGLLPANTPTWEPFIFVALITLLGYLIAYWRVARILKS